MQSRCVHGVCVHIDAVEDRIYVETTAEQLPALTAALEPYDAELVPILSEAPASGSYLLTA